MYSIQYQNTLCTNANYYPQYYQNYHQHISSPINRVETAQIGYSEYVQPMYFKREDDVAAQDHEDSGNESSDDEDTVRMISSWQTKHYNTQ